MAAVPETKLHSKELGNLGTFEAGGDAFLWVSCDIRILQKIVIGL